MRAGSLLAVSLQSPSLPVSGLTVVGPRRLPSAAPARGPVVVVTRFPSHRLLSLF